MNNNKLIRRRRLISADAGVTFDIIMIQEKYVPPDWALGLNYIPSTYIKVCSLYRVCGLLVDLN